MNIDPETMFPAAAKRVKILEALQHSWGSVVGIPVARHSWPRVLGVNMLAVYADNDYVAGRLANMKGNILRALSSLWGYVPEGEFSVKVERSRPKESRRNERVRMRRKIIVDEEAVNEYMRDSPEGLPEDINYALSHLKAYLDVAKKISP